MKKFFLSHDGQLVGEPNEDHADIARRVLPELGGTIGDYAGLYDQMFAFGFARVAVDSKEFHIERKEGLSDAQRQVMEEALRTSIEVYFNDQRFIASKEIRGVGGTLADQLGNAEA